MLPKCIQNLIETYAMDMSLHEELSKTKINKRLLREADSIFFTEIDPIFTEGRMSIEKLVQTLDNVRPKWDKTAAGWCLERLEDMYLKRCQLWWGIGIQEFCGDRQLIGQWIDASAFWQTANHFIEQLMEYEETRDDYLIGPIDEL